MVDKHDGGDILFVWLRQGRDTKYSLGGMKLKKIGVLIVLLCVAAGLLVACGGSDDNDGSLRIALITGTGGLGDDSFNDMAWAGLQQASDLYDIEIVSATPASAADFETLMRQFAEPGDFDLIIISSVAGATPLRNEVAPEFPNQRFTIVDANVDEHDNVRSIFKNFAEMTFLGGYLAGLTSTTGQVAIVIGTDSPTMNDAARGFIAGATLANPNIDAQLRIVGSFADAPLGAEITHMLVAEGFDVVMSFAGGSGTGVINAATESGIPAIGGAFHITATQPDTVMASVGENFTPQILAKARSIVKDTWQATTFFGALADDYVGISFANSNRTVPADVQAQVEAARARIVSGSITIPGSIAEIPAWAAANQ